MDRLPHDTLPGPDASFTTSSLDDPQPYSVRSSGMPGRISRAPRKGAILSVLALSLVVVLIATTLLLRAMDGGKSAATANSEVYPVKTPTSGYAITIYPTYTPGPLPPTWTPGGPADPNGGYKNGVDAPPPQFPQPGWRAIGPGFATGAAFSVSNPLIGYVCGPEPFPNGASGIPTAPIEIARTTDGGKTFGPATVLEASQACTLTVDPTNPDDVALLLNSCISGCAPSPPDDLFRTLDGGKTWTQLMVPADSTQTHSGSGFNRALFAGSTLFAQGQLSYDNGTNPHTVAASVNNGPLQWVDSAFLTANQMPTLGFAFGATCYMEVYTYNTLTPQGSSPPSVSWYSTTNGGVTWIASQPFSVHGVELTVIASDPQAHYLVGADYTNPGVQQNYISADSGKTWQPMPSIPNGSYAFVNNIFIVPDGTIISQANLPSGTTGISSLAPGSTTWQNIAMIAGGPDLVATMYDVNGHLTAIWANAGFNGMHLPQRGLQAHTP